MRLDANSRRAVATAVCLVVLTAGVGGAAVWAASRQDGPARAPQTAEAARTAEPAGTGRVTIDLSDPAFTTDSSPALVRLTPKDGDGKPTYAVVSAGTDEEARTVDVAPGDYAVHVTSPVNADGSIYSIPDSDMTVGGGDVAEPEAITAPDTSANPTTEASSSAQTVRPDKTQVPVDQVTDEQREQIQKELEDASREIESGDAKVSGGNPDDVRLSVEDARDRAEQNLGKRDDADAQQAETPSSSGSSKEAAKSSSDGRASDASSPSSNSSSSTNSNGNGSNSNGQSSGQSEKRGCWKTVEHPAVTHEETVYRTETVTVTDSPATTRRYLVCSTCGYETQSASAMTAHINQAHEGAGDMDMRTETVPAKTHTETRKVPAGTKTVVDTPAWTERVWVEE